MTEELRLAEFVDLERVSHRQLLEVENIFQLFGQSFKERLQEFLAALGVRGEPLIEGEVHPQAIIEGAVYIAKGAKVGPGAYIQGPTYVGPGAEVRHCAFIRGNAYIGPSAVVGHTSEVKGAIFLDEAKAGHFAYVGDSILGRNVNLGAGTKLANLKLSGSPVKVRIPNSQKRISSMLRKLGSILGDESQTGCNSVLSPGTLLLPKTLVMPCVHFQGTLERGIAK